MPSKNKDNYKFFRCQCTSEGLLVTKGDFDLPEIFVSVYTNWKRVFTFWDRITEALRVGLYTFKNGHPYTDEIVLSMQNAYDIGQYLIESAEQLQNELDRKKKTNKPKQNKKYTYSITSEAP